MRDRGHHSDGDIVVQIEEFFEVCKEWYTELIKYREFQWVVNIFFIIILMSIIGRMLLFKKADESPLKALIPFVSLRTYYSLAWGENTNKAFFATFIPAIGYMIYLITVVLVWIRFKGGVLTVMLLVMFPPLGEFILGCTGKFNRDSVKETKESIESYFNTIDGYSTSDGEATNKEYESVWGKDIWATEDDNKDDIWSTDRR